MMTWIKLGIYGVSSMKICCVSHSAIAQTMGLFSFRETNCSQRKALDMPLITLDIILPTHFPNQTHYLLGPKGVEVLENPPKDLLPAFYSLLKTPCVCQFLLSASCVLISVNGSNLLKEEYLEVTMHMFLKERSCFFFFKL